jgi:class 3 adenylate cyclase/DNA-binding NarL/FixJ family response regulator
MDTNDNQPLNPRGENALAAIVFTDVESFTPKMAADEKHTLALIQRDFQLMTQQCQQFEGKLLKSLGDGLLIYFVSAEKAVAYAIAIQKALADCAAKLPQADILHHRIGIHLGDVIFSGDDVMGNNVNLAARLQTLAEPGGICLSQTVYDVVKHHLSITPSSLEEQKLKGITDPVLVYRIAPPEGFRATTQPNIFMLPKSEPLKILAVDDHELILNGTLNFLKQQYPEAEILTAQTAQKALQQVETFQPNLVVMDLSIPETAGDTAEINQGIQTLRTLMKNYPFLNLVVQSSYVKALVRIKPDIDVHQGGFTIVDKGLSSQVMLARIDFALKGVTHTKDLKMPPGEFKPEWITVLNLAFAEGLEDKLIAERMCVAPRTVRHYWTKVQDVLGVYPEDGKSLRIQTEKRAREEGFID